MVRGLPNLGGPIVTAGGLVFIAAALDDNLRAFDVSTGREVWQAALPAGGQATPMTYITGGSAVRRHRRGRPRQTGQQARRRRRRFLSAARGWHDTLALRAVMQPE